MQIDVVSFVQELAWQHLKNTALVDDQDPGEINPGHEDQLVSLINMGLRDITTRKKILTETRIVTFIADTNTYDILTAPNQDDRLVQIIEVVGVLDGYDVITQNKRTFTPQTTRHIQLPNYHTVWFSDEFMEDYTPAVDVVVQVHHEIVSYLSNSFIKLNPTLTEALKLYTAGLYLTHMGGDENRKQGDSYYGLYLKMMEDDKLDNTSNVSEVVDYDTRFSDRGFV